MVSTVRLDADLEEMLNRVSKILDKKKSEVIREAIRSYVQTIEDDKKTKILRAIDKTKIIDKKEYKAIEGTLDDGI